MTAAAGRICTAIAARGWAVEADFLSPAVIAALAADARDRDAADEFHAAGVGRDGSLKRQSEVRGDRTLWLDPDSTVPARQCLAQAMEALRLALNEDLQLGLFSLEAHYALYPPGASYRRHRDVFQDAGAAADARVVSCALYLNARWGPADGGALRIYDGIYDNERTHDVLPVSGTLACFLSQRFEQEVLPATRDRLAVTGWFRRRP